MNRKHGDQPGIAAAIQEAVRGFIRDDGLRLSAAISYYSAFSLAPLLLVILAIAGTFFDEEAVRGALDEELRRGLGPSGALVVQDMVAHAQRPAENFLMSAVAMGLLLLGASGLFGQLQAALDKIWKVEGAGRGGISGLIRERFLSFLMVLGTGFLLLTSMVLSVALQATSDRIERVLPLPGTFWTALGVVVSYTMIVLLFAAIFKMLPKAAIRWRDVWVGAVFTASLFVVGKTVIAWYLAREATESSYGPAAALILVLMWFYYSSIILLLGAEFTRAWSSSGARSPGGEKTLRTS